jgi:hypothetical protein
VKAGSILARSTVVCGQKGGDGKHGATSLRTPSVHNQRHRLATREDGAVLSDGRVSRTDDHLKMVRKWVDDIQVHRRTVCEPGSLMAVDIHVHY